MLFFVAVCILLTIVLWSVRSKRYSLPVWLITLTIAFSIAYAGQLGLRQLQASIEASFLGIFDQFMWRYRDPNRTTTAMGSLGRLKLSDRIVLRLKSEQVVQTPFLLNEASYNTFAHGIWNNKESDFTVLEQNLDKSWTLMDKIEAESTVTLSTYMVREKGVIPLPHRSSKIKNVAAVEIEKNQHGTVIMDMREGWIQYDVEYNGNIQRELPPDENDLHILDYYRADFDKLAKQLKLSSMTGEQAVFTVHRFFQDNFTYSLNRKQRYPKGKYLSDFLFKNRQGHCEYFATATTLLLRSAGIPARYAVGYSVSEYSSLERQYVARARHAHSWALVYVNNEWQVLDTTPSIWAPYEEENASALEPFMDLWAWVSFTWSRWQSEDVVDKEQNTDFLLWLLIPLIALLAWRMYFKERIKRKRPSSLVRDKIAYSGIDSSFYELIEQIEQDGLPRHPGETLITWFRRIDSRIQNSQLETALKLHYQYRFDPSGLSSFDAKELQRIVSLLLSCKNEWLSAQNVA
jgi:hypothetical protein